MAEFIKSNGIRKRTFNNCNNIIISYVNIYFIYMKKIKIKILMQQFLKENPTVLDDDIPNKFDEWIGERMGNN